MKKTTKLLLSSACVLAVTGGGAVSAYAADMAVRGYSPPPPVAMPSWAGGYLGATVGVARLNATATPVDPSYGYYGPCTNYYTGPTSCTTSDTGFAAGVNAGYDWQSRNFVYGVVADWTWTDLKHDLAGTNMGSGYGGTFHADVDWLASFRGRAGLAVDDTMVYLTGGVALAEIKSSLITNGTANSQTVPNYGALSGVKVGWVAGAGIEHKFDPHWSIKAEFLYYDFGRSTASNSAGENYTTEFNHEVMLGQVGLGYHF